MFGIQLTLVQKLEVAFICVILGIAGFLVFRNAQPTFDRTITSYSLATRQHPINDNANHSLRPSATNPADPKKDESTIVFACSDGQLEITQYPNDSARHPLFTWKPDRRQQGSKYQYYLDPMAPVDSIKDPFRHALAYATYNTIYGSAKGLLGRVGMTPEQVAKEATARELMLGEINLVNNQVEGGTYYPKLMDEVMKALAAYNAKSGDPTKDPAKAALAHKVMEAVKAFLSQEESDKDKSIDKYMDVLVKALDESQQQKLIDAYHVSTQPAYRPTTPTARRAPAPAATARGNRGAARGTTVPAGG